MKGSSSITVFLAFHQIPTLPKVIPAAFYVRKILSAVLNGHFNTSYQYTLPFPVLCVGVNFTNCELTQFIDSTVKYRPRDNKLYNVGEYQQIYNKQM